MIRRPRWATPDDNQPLIDLVRACPMHGSIPMYFDRGPDFFALSALQGSGARVCVVDGDTPGTLTATAAVAEFPRVHVDGKVQRVGYACDLRVHHDHRGGRTVKRIYDFMTDYGVGLGWNLVFTTIMKDNAAMAAVLSGKGGVLPYYHVTTLRNFGVQFLLPKRPPKGLSVRPATREDLPAMVELWNRVNGQKQFAPHWEEAELLERFERLPGYRLSNYRLAFRGDRLVGLLCTWDQHSFKRMVILGFSPEMLRMKRWYNPLSRMLGLCPIPEVGSAMPYFYATHLCAETPQDLRALLVDVYNQKRGREYLFFSAMLDTRDPLISAFDGFITNRVDIELFAMDPLRQWEGHPFDQRPSYFDPSIV